MVLKLLVQDKFAKRDSTNHKSKGKIVMAAIAHVHSGNGSGSNGDSGDSGGGGMAQNVDESGAVVRMRMVMTKQQLKHMLLSMNRSTRSNVSNTTPIAPSLEQLLHVMRRWQLKKVAAEVAKGHRSTWRPALQSIPEEL